MVQGLALVFYFEKSVHISHNRVDLVHIDCTQLDSNTKMVLELWFVKFFLRKVFTLRRIASIKSTSIAPNLVQTGEWCKG